MNRDETLFVLWHVSVLGLAAVAVVLGWAEPLMANGREAIVAVIGGLYLLSLALSCRLMWRIARVDTTDEVPGLYRRLKGIDLVARLVAMLGLAGTVYGVVIGTKAMVAAGDGGAEQAAKVVAELSGALGLGFTATLVSIVTTMVLIVSRHFVGNVAYARG